MSRIRRLAGGVIASSSPSDSGWWRVYADGWCEQGGTTTENVSTNLKVPFDSNTYSVTATVEASAPDNGLDVVVISTYKTTSSIYATIGNNWSGDGKLNWRAEGWISAESLANVKAGKTWDPSTGTWS